MHGRLPVRSMKSGKLKERKGGHTETTAWRGDSATNPSGSDNLLSEVCALTSWKYSLGRMPKGTCCHCGCTDEKPCRMAPNPHGPIAGQPAATCTWADRGRICFSLPAPLSKAGLHLTMRSLLLVFGLRPGCGCGLFGARDNRRGRRLRRFVFLSDLNLATHNRAIFDDDAPRLHVACNSAAARNLDALALEGANHFTVNDNFAGFDS